MNTLNIKSDIIRQSARTADSFLNDNKHLANVSTYYEYNQRFSGFADIVDAETGFASFTPFVSLNVEQDWQNVLSNGESELYFQKLNDMAVHDADGSYWARAALHDLFHMVKYLKHADIIARVVTAEIADFIKNKKTEFPEQFKTCPSSPKLTKLVGWMFGEKKGGAMDYLTTKCPREDKAGAVEEYRIFISVLPHNVAGMSYYSSKNHGGDSWQGYNGTSCQDPYRCDDSNLINHLPASIKEQTLAVAWLAKRENNDIWKPVYEARTNIRIVPCENKNVFIICHPYATNPTTRNVLVNGLLNQFPDTMIFGNEVNRWGSCDVTEIIVPIADCEYEGISRHECNVCGGNGIEYIEHYCNCEHCEQGDEEQECEECAGTGYYENDSENFLPYLDDTGIIDIECYEVTYNIPTDILVKMGAVNELELIEE